MKPTWEADGVRLYCADALDVLASMDSRTTDSVVTDPPYGINTKSDGFGKLSPWADLCNSSLWYATWIREARRLLRPSGSLWSCLNWRSLVTFQKASCDLRFPITSLMVWDKEWIGPGGPSGLRPSYELVALWAMPDFAVADRGVPDVQRFKWTARKPTGHPAEKPVGLMRFCIEHGTRPSGTVCDPFMGAGTSGVAAIQSGRSYIGVEIDAEYFGLAVDRIRKSLDGGPIFRRGPSGASGGLFPESSAGP